MVKKLWIAAAVIVAYFLFIGNDSSNGNGDNGGGDGQSPTASITTDLGSGGILSLDGSGSSDPDGTIESYNWTVTDSSGSVVAEPTGETTNAFLPSEGDYTVSLTVTDDSGKTDTADTSVTWDSGGGGNQSPTAAISTDIGAGGILSLDGSSSSDPDGSIASWDWTVTGSSGATVAEPGGETANAILPEEGTYTVSLTVTDGAGATDSAQTSVTWNTGGGGNNPPTAQFTYDVDTSDDTLYLDAGGSSDTDGNIVTYEWEIYADGMLVSGRGGETTSYGPLGGGDYEVDLTVTDDDGATDTTSATFSYQPNTSPTAAFEYSIDPLSDTLTLDGSLSADVDGSIVSWDWDIDLDGSDYDTGTGATYTADLLSEGDYTVTLTVTDDRGATDTSDDTFYHDPYAI